jgi:glutamine amidotransferase PdxT
MAFSPSVFYFAPPDPSARVKAVFIYNFSKYVEWKEANRAGIFTIGVLGTSTVTNELTTITTGKAVGTQKIEIKTFATIAEVKKCHILFIPSDNSTPLPAIISKIKGNNTLLVTEKDGCVKQGSIINFIIQSNKQKFELSKSNAEKADLKISQNLVTLGIAVD